jgi:hypothetical protein
MTRRVGCVCLLALAAVAPAGGVTQSSGPRQTVGRMSGRGDHDPVEVSIAINPANPDNIVAVSYQQGLTPGPRTSDFVYVSTDGGASWTSQPAANPDARTQGDDAVTFDETGTAFHTHIAFLGIRQARPLRAVTGVFVSRSDDGGRTWQSPVAAVDHANTVLPFEDKPWPAATRTAGGQSHVYLAWTRFDEYGSKAPDCRSHIVFSRSIDGGKSFAMPFRISDLAGDCLDSDNTDEGAVPAVGPNGEIYLAWAGPAGLVFDVSKDAGETFGTDVKIADLPGGWDFEVPGVDRANGMPVTAVDRSAGTFRGSIYVNWIDARHGDPDVFVAVSRDGGRTWSAPIRVNDDPVGNGKIQFFTWMAVDPTDGSINVIFYDRRAQTGTRTAVTVARSTDGGRTFVNYPVNLPAFETASSPGFGDYIGISAYRRRVVGAFPYFVDAKTIALAAVRFDF